MPAPALKEFANFITMNTINLAGTYAQILAENSHKYAAFPEKERTSCGRKLLKAVTEALTQDDVAPLLQIFKQPSTRWPANIRAPHPLTEVECLGLTLNPVVTNLEAGKLLWQLLHEIREALAPAPGTAPLRLVEVAPPTGAEISASETTLLRQLIDNLPDLVYVKDTQSRFLTANAALCRQLGAAASEEVVGKTDFDFSPRELTEKYFADEQALLHSGQSLIALEEPFFDHATGTRRWSSSTKIVFKDKQGNVAGLMGLNRDITVQKENEVRLKQLANQLKTVAEVSTAISTILDVDQLLQAVVDLTKERFSLYHVHIYLLEPEEDVLVMTAGAGEVGLKLLAQRWEIPRQRESSLVAQAARLQQPVVVNNVQQSPDYYQNPLLPETRAEMAVPLMAGPDVLGVLDVQVDQVDYFSTDDEQIYSSLAAQIAVALRNASLYRQTQEALSASEVLYQASAQLNTAESFDDILEAFRRYTIMGNGAQNMTINVFDRPWKNDRAPEWVEILARWSKLLPQIDDDRYPRAAFPAAENLLRPDIPVIVEDITVDDRLDDNTRTFYEERFGGRSMIFIPLVAASQWVGFINASYEDPIQFSDAAVRQLVALSGQAAVAIQALQRLMATQRQANHEQAIRAITEKMRAASSVENLISITARELGHHLGAGRTVVSLDAEDL